MLSFVFLLLLLVIIYFVCLFVKRLLLVICFQSFSRFSPTFFDLHSFLFSLSFSLKNFLSFSFGSFLSISISCVLSRFPTIISSSSLSPISVSLSPSYPFDFLPIPSFPLFPFCYHSTLLFFGCFEAEKSIKKAERAGVGGGGSGVRIGTGGRAEDMYPRRHSIIPERAPFIPSPTRTPWTNDPRGRKFTRTARYRERSLF